MSIVIEKYTANRVNLLHQMLVNDAEQGQPRDYEIKVDDLKVVQRTDDPERFHQHEEFVQPDTQCITISIFDGGSRRCAKYQLYLGDTRPNLKEATLSGIEDTIQEKITAERRQWEYEQIKKEKEDLEKQLAEAEEYAEDLEKALKATREEFDALKQKRVGMAEMNAGKMLGFAADYLVKNQSSLVKKMPLLSGLSGILGGEENAPDTMVNTSSDGGSGSTVSASFSKKQGQSDQIIESKLLFFIQMEEAFTEPQLEKTIEIIDYLTRQPEQVEKIYQSLCVGSDSQKTV